MTTLKAIAEKTGFSISVVSRTLNPKPDASAVISEPTRQVIQEAARELGYQRNRAAEFLKRGRTPEIGLFMPPHSNRLASDLIFGMARVAQAEGFPISIHHGMDLASYRQFIEANLATMRCGLITYPFFALDKSIIRLIARYREQGGHLLLINPQPADPGEIPFVAIDDHAGGRLAAEHLLARGCRSFVLYGDFPHRDAGFQAALRDAGFEAALIPQGNAMFDTCLAHLGALKRSEPIGVFAPTDRWAVHLSTRLAHTSWRVGQQVRVVGYDNLSLTEHVYPSLTTVEQPFGALGETAVRVMIAMIYGRPVRPVMLEPKLVIRETT